MTEDERTSDRGDKHWDQIQEGLNLCREWEAVLDEAGPVRGPAHSIAGYLRDHYGWDEEQTERCRSTMLAMFRTWDREAIGLAALGDNRPAELSLYGGEGVNNIDNVCGEVSMKREDSVNIGCDGQDVDRGVIQDVIQDVVQDVVQDVTQDVTQDVIRDADQDVSNGNRCNAELESDEESEQEEQDRRGAVAESVDVRWVGVGNVVHRCVSGLGRRAVRDARFVASDSEIVSGSEIAVAWDRFARTLGDTVSKIRPSMQDQRQHMVAIMDDMAYQKGEAAAQLRALHRIVVESQVSTVEGSGYGDRSAVEDTKQVSCWGYLADFLELFEFSHIALFVLVVASVDRYWEGEQFPFVWEKRGITRQTASDDVEQLIGCLVSVARALCMCSWFHRPTSGSKDQDSRGEEETCTDDESGGGTGQECDSDNRV